MTQVVPAAAAVAAVAAAAVVVAAAAVAAAAAPPCLQRLELHRVWPHQHVGLLRVRVQGCPETQCVWVVETDLLCQQDIVHHLLERMLEKKEKEIQVAAVEIQRSKKVLPIRTSRCKVVVVPTPYSSSK